MKITGFILAGGKSSRMGEDKGLIFFKGKAMVEHTITTLEKFAIPIVIIANNNAYGQFGLPVFSDLIKDKGPAGGIYTALTKSNTETNIILSCDSPFVTEQLINQLIKAHKGHQVTFPRYNNKTHPLIGIYNKSIVEIYKSNIEKGMLKLKSINSTLDTLEVEFNEETIDNKNCFSNINTQAELKQLEI